MQMCHLKIPVYDRRLTVVQPPDGGADITEDGQGLALRKAAPKSMYCISIHIEQMLRN